MIIKLDDWNNTSIFNWTNKNLKPTEYISFTSEKSTLKIEGLKPWFLQKNNIEPPSKQTTGDREKNNPKVIIFGSE